MAYHAPPSAPPAAALDPAEQEAAKIPHDLERWGNDKLTALSGPVLASLCTQRGLAKGGSKADKVARLLNWKKKIAKPKEPRKKRVREVEGK
jgi:hypothetical protein